MPRGRSSQALDPLGRTFEAVTLAGVPGNGGALLPLRLRRPRLAIAGNLAYNAKWKVDT